MRPYAILLLFCALARAMDATRDCKAEAERVVAANGDQKIVYDEQKKRLSCADGENAPKAIEWQSTRFKALECSDKDHLWRDTDSTKDPIGGAKEWNNKIVDANNPPIVKCVEYCAIIGEGIERTLSKNSVNAKCSGGGQLFINNKRIGPAILCSSQNQWIFYENLSNGILITTETFTPLQAECKKACNHGKRAEGVVSTVNEGQTVIKCDKSNNNGEKYGITVNGGTIYSDLKCDQNGYTVANDATVAGVYEEVNIECANGVTFSDRPCFYNFKDPLQMRFDSETKTLTCVEEADKLMAIEFNSNLYKSLTCNDFGGWMEGSNIIAEILTKIEAKCVEYCAVEKLESTMLNTLDSGKRTISCYENMAYKSDKKDLVLLVNDQPSYNPNYYAVCDLKMGWDRWNNNTRLSFIFSKDTTTPARVDCKRACAQITHGSEVLSMITSRRNSTENKFLETRFECSDEQKYGIRVNKEFMYPYVNCNEIGLMKGSVDNEREQIVADPFKPVHLDCALFPTTTTSTTTTTTTTTTPAPTTSVIPERPIEKADTVQPKKPKPTGDDDIPPRSTKSSIFVISIYSTIFILIGYGNP